MPPRPFLPNNGASCDKIRVAGILRTVSFRFVRTGDLDAHPAFYLAF